jgi:hypothetical protein
MLKRRPRPTDGARMLMSKGGPMSKGIEAERRLPASTCCLCGRSIQAAGGRRIVATGGSRIVERRAGDDPGFAVALRETLREVSADALEDHRAGLRLWWCQQCARRVCAACGSPTELVPGADLLEDDGTVVHQMIVPASAGCTSPACTESRRDRRWS